jgi:hypothetical protein
MLGGRSRGSAISVYMTGEPETATRGKFWGLIRFEGLMTAYRTIAEVVAQPELVGDAVKLPRLLSGVLPLAAVLGVM